RGLRTLRPDRKLRAAALAHSRDMVERDFFEHVSPDGVGHHERIVRTGYRLRSSGFATGENLATGREGNAATPAVVVDGWLHSEGHRRNALRPEFEEIGIGIVPRETRGGPGATYTTTFAGRD
ncbi:MAG: CAP domain-containing protein, partial [Actinomycetota bacterium]|nr:CAP domain-containing protein [Actinomycetota bacterium]